MNIFGTTGQERRAWLDRQGQNVLDTIQYYAGPGLPVNALATIADAFNPVSDIGRAGTAARGATMPGLTGAERLGYVGSAATDMASVLAPVAGAAYADDAARGLTESLANWTMPADDAAARFFVDEDGAIRAWHGSPHDFDRFSMDKIGTGEGAQAYGHGLYFAESPGVARSYRDALSNSDAPLAVWKRPDGSEIDGFDVPGSVTLLRNNDVDVPFPTLMERAEREFARASSVRNPQLREAQTRKAQEALDWLRSNEGIGLSSHPERGRLYEVEINANPEDFLDWDAPLSAQPESVKSVLGDSPHLTAAAEMSRAYRNPMFGGDLLKSPTASPEELSRGLAQRGIPGIRYLDAGSRGAGDGSRNYVVFDDRLITILNKLGIAGLGTSAALNMQPSEDEELRAYLQQ